MEVNPKVRGLVSRMEASEAVSDINLMTGEP